MKHDLYLDKEIILLAGNIGSDIRMVLSDNPSHFR